MTSSALRPAANSPAPLGSRSKSTACRRSEERRVRRELRRQWLGLRKVAESAGEEPVSGIRPAPRGFHRARERGVLRGNPAPRLDARNPIKSDFCHQRAARPLLRHRRREGDEFRRVPAPPESHRGGVAHAGVDPQHHLEWHAHFACRGAWCSDDARHDPACLVADAGEIASKVPASAKRPCASGCRFIGKTLVHAATTRSIRSASRWKTSTPPANGASRKRTIGPAASNRTIHASTPARRCPTARNSKEWKACKRSF